MDHYIFDKRIMKKFFLKYGLIMLGLFVILVVFNTLCPIEDSTTAIIVDMSIGLGYVLLVEFVLSKIKQRRQEKEEIESREKKEREIIVEAEVVDKKKGNRQNTSKKDKK